MQTINLANNISLEFDPGRHKYYLDGRQLHGVTGIAELTGENGWRIPWAAKMCSEVADELIGPLIDEVELPKIVRQVKGAPFRKSSDAIDIGNAAHSWLEQYTLFLIGEAKAPAAEKPIRLASKPAAPKNKIVKEAVRPFVQWVKDNDPEFLAAEQVIYYEGKYDFAGTMDLRFRLGDDLCIGDFKTSKMLKREYIFQLGLYACAIEKTFPDQKVKKLFLFRLPKIEGDEMEVREFPFTKTLKECCLGLNKVKHIAVDIDQWLKKSSKKKG